MEVASRRRWTSWAFPESWMSTRPHQAFYPRDNSNMRPTRHIGSAAASISFAVLVIGCRDAVQPDVDPSAVAGTYVLESVSGRYAPISGGFVLTLDAQAERRV